MPLRNGYKDDEDVNGSERDTCDSPMTKIRGLDKLGIRSYYARGSVLFAEGQPPRGIYILCDGKAKVSIASAGGKTLVLMIAQPGELLGLNAALTGKPYMATVETVERCRIDFVSREELLKLLDRDTRTHLAVMQTLNRQLSSLVDHTRLLFLSHSAAEKVARLLLRWCEDNGRLTTRGIRIKSGLTHEEIAQMISTSRETVTRELSILKRKRILESENGDLLVLDRAALMVSIKG